ncbi:MAG: hypothetical protein ABFD80_09360 [Acidobacteriota bacterium]
MNKTRIFRQTILALAALALLASVAPAQTAAQKPFLASWKGEISVMGQTLEIRLVFKLDEAKQIAGTFDSISQGAAGLKLTDILIEGKTITCAIDPSLVPGNATFKGTLDAAGTKLAGDFSQAGYTGTFSVEIEKPQK